MKCASKELLVSAILSAPVNGLMVSTNGLEKIHLLDKLLFFVFFCFCLFFDLLQFFADTVTKEVLVWKIQI